MSKITVRTLLGGALSLLALAALAPPALARTIAPDTGADQNGTVSSQCALREAIMAANTDAGFGGCPAGNGFDVILLAPRVYRLTLVADGALGINEPGALSIVNRSPRSARIDAAALGDRPVSIFGSGIVTFSGVTLQNGDASSNGGGIRVEGGTLNLYDSAVVGNSTQISGGGIHVFGSADLNLTNVTISGNSARNSGGGLNASNGSIDLVNVTISANRADSDASGGGNGGGLAEASATIEAQSTVISGNADLSGDNRARNCEGEFTSLGRTRVGAQEDFFSDCLWTFTPGSGDLFNADVALHPLGANGGPTPTHALPPRSEAVNLGGACPGADQRRAPRALGGPCDAGAYEVVRCGARIVNGVGTAGRDRLVLSGRPDVVLGLGGSDRIFGRSGNDRICGGPGRDRLFGGRGRDRLLGGPGRDFLFGGPGRDLLRGGPGRDFQRQ